MHYPLCMGLVHLLLQLPTERSEHTDMMVICGDSEVTSGHRLELDTYAMSLSVTSAPCTGRPTGRLLDDQMAV